MRHPELWEDLQEEIENMITVKKEAALSKAAFLESKKNKEDLKSDSRVKRGSKVVEEVLQKRRMNNQRPMQNAMKMEEANQNEATTGYTMAQLAHMRKTSAQASPKAMEVYRRIHKLDVVKKTREEELKTREVEDELNKRHEVVR
jgi:hypothetical protein